MTDNPKAFTDTNALVKVEANHEHSLKSILSNFSKVWRHAKAQQRLLLLSAAAGIVLGLVLGYFFLQKSRVEGIYQLIGPVYFRGSSNVEALQFGALNLAQFKALQALAADRSRIRQFSKAKNLDGAIDDINLENVLGDPSRQQQVIEIQYGASKADAKALADPAALKNEAATVLGIRIKSTHRSAEVANSNVLSIGAFLTDTLFLHELTNYSIGRAEELKRSRLSAERKVLETKLALKFNNERIRELRQIAARSGDASRGDSRTVLSLTKETIPYLPIPTQIAAIEVSNLESNIMLKEEEIKVNYNKYSQAYYEALHKFASQAALGADVVKQLPKIKAQIDERFANVAQEIKPASLALDQEIAAIEDTFIRRNRFLAPPATVSRGLVLTMALAVFMGLLFMAAAFLWTFFADRIKQALEESGD